MSDEEFGVEFPADKVNEDLLTLPDEELEKLAFAVPWQEPDYSIPRKDADGFDVFPEIDAFLNFPALQRACWLKFLKSPPVNSSIRDLVGRLAGRGFSVTSEVFEIQKKVDDISNDLRNRLYLMLPKFIARASVEGELFLCFTLHEDGFVEIDFMDPSTLRGPGASGILFHPKKPTLPLAYFFDRTSNGVSDPFAVPSIFCAYYPELLDILEGIPEYREADMSTSKVSGKEFSQFHGYFRFIVQWDKSYFTPRNLSHVRTVLEWVSYYENLKKYEIDHKKSSGAYLWVFTIEDAKAFRMWLALSPEERKKTGIESKKTPGGTIILPPGIKLEVKNPQLPKISDQDNDILQMVISGLNAPEDMIIGKAGSYGSTKVSRGPQSDRISDEIEYLERFLRYDFWRHVFFLCSSKSNFPKTFKREEVIDFKNKKPVKKKIDREPHELLDFTFPVSEIQDLESVSRALLGVKHGNVNNTLGISHKTISKRLGIGDWDRQRRITAMEEERYPKLQIEVDQESVQEKTEGEPSKKEGGVSEKKEESSVKKTNKAQDKKSSE